MSNTLLDLDNLLDSTLDSVENIADFANPPTGSYILDVADAKTEAYKDKEGKAGNRFRIIFSVASTLELKDPKERPVADNTQFSSTYQATEEGLKYFKRDAAKLLNASLDGVKLRDILAELKEVRGVEAHVITKEKNGYENVNVRPIWPDAAPES